MEGKGVEWQGGGVNKVNEDLTASRADGFGQLSCSADQLTS